MKLIRTLSLSLALAASVTTAFADDKKPAPATNEVAKADVDKFIAFFDSLVAVVVKDQASCPAMAVDVNKLADDNAALLKMAADAKGSGKQLPKYAIDHMMQNMSKLQPGMQKCGADKDVGKAFERAGFGGHKK